MKNQKKSAIQKNIQGTNGKWMTAKDAAEKLGINFSIENTYHFKKEKELEKRKWN